MLAGASPGCLVKDLECRSTKTSFAEGAGIAVEEFTVAANEPPAVIENCTVTNCVTGIQVAGMDLITRRARPCSGVCVRGNRIHGGRGGLAMAGRINNVQVVANQFWDVTGFDLLVLELLEGSGQILFANNSFKDVMQCVTFADFGKDVHDIQFQNNLLLVDRGPDITFRGTNRQSLDPLRLAHNWRSAQPPDAQAPDAKDWVLSDQDTFSASVELVSLDPAHADFLRPKSESTLAASGAGESDASLPAYIGAVPPEGVEGWDWIKTWTVKTARPGDR
jgi:hypothetical protein